MGPGQCWVITVFFFLVSQAPCFFFFSPTQFVAPQRIILCDFKTKHREYNSPHVLFSQQSNKGIRIRKLLTSFYAILTSLSIFILNPFISDSHQEGHYYYLFLKFYKTQFTKANSHKLLIPKVQLNDCLLKFSAFQSTINSVKFLLKNNNSIIF